MPPIPTGVWLIELAPLADPSQIIPAIAQVFGLQELSATPLSSLVMDYLRDKIALLILDNCEHLIEACARLADELLHQCAELKIIASSREALGIAGEAAYRTPSLAESESTQLFVERARAVNSKFSLTEGSTAAIAQICRRLDGIPLAIELAAARVRLLSPEQIAVRLDDRFRLLVGGSRTALPRQQTLRALIDWSYDLLSDEEKRLLQNASVFVGGWTLDALEAVADDIDAMDHLEQLVNKSLVVTDEREGDMRYSMLETIRQYAREKLFDSGQAAQARERHFVYFDNFAEVVWNAFRSPEMVAWRDRAFDEIENLRAALEWGLENHVEDAIHLATSSCIILGWVGNPVEGLALVKSAIDRAKSLPSVEGIANIRRRKIIARALCIQGWIGMSTGFSSLVLESIQEAISISRSTGDKLILGYSLEMYSTASTYVNLPGGFEAAEEGLAVLSELNDKWGLGLAYQNLAKIASSRGDRQKGQIYFGMLKELMQDQPMSFQAGMFFLGMGRSEIVQGQYEAAKSHFEDGLNIFKRLGYKNFQIMFTSELGHLARYQGDIKQAKKIYHETIASWRDLGNRSAIAHELECFGFISIAEEEPQRAIKLFGAAEALREKIKAQMTDQERIEYDQAVAQVRGLLDEKEFDELWAEGRLMSMEQAIQFALS